MSWIVVQIQEPYQGNEHILNPCFRVVAWFETYKDAVQYRNDTENVDYFVIIQAW